jgi:hypothetical protein
VNFLAKPELERSEQNKIRLRKADPQTTAHAIFQSRSTPSPSAGASRSTGEALGTATGTNSMRNAVVFQWLQKPP